MQTPLLATDEPKIEQRNCSTCAHSRGKTGELAMSLPAADCPLFDGHDRAFCVQADVSQGDGTDMPCERQRFAPSSVLVATCGAEGIFWTPRA